MTKFRGNVETAISNNNKNVACDSDLHDKLDKAHVFTILGNCCFNGNTMIIRVLVIVLM